jgi:RNA polymerase primary sigma factor
MLAEEQGYLTFDDIMDCSDEYSLSIQDYNWLSSTITTRGVLVYNENPPLEAEFDKDEHDDYAQSDYDLVYDRIIELSPSLEPFVSYVRTVIPPQKGEVNRLKYQIIEGNTYARDRLIEMYLRLALRIALQRADAYDMDIEDSVAYACIGLIIAVDKYDPDYSGPFATYASLWIFQNISRRQSTQRPLIYYPVHKREDYFTMYPILKNYGCIDCYNFPRCDEAVQIVCRRIDCSEKDAKVIIEQMVPDERIDELIEQYLDEIDEYTPMMDTAIDTVLRNLSADAVVSREDAFISVQNNMLRELLNDVFDIITPREEKIIRLRYGMDGDEPQTLEEIGSVFNLTRERIRQIEAKAFRKLRHTSRLKRLVFHIWD